MTRSITWKASSPPRVGDSVLCEMDGQGSNPWSCSFPPRSTASASALQKEPCTCHYTYIYVQNIIQRSAFLDLSSEWLHMFPLIKFDPNMHTFQSHAALCNFNLFTCRYYVPQLYSRAHQQWSVARSLEASVHHVDQKRTIVGFPNSVSAVFDVAAALLSLYIYICRVSC